MPDSIDILKNSRFYRGQIYNVKKIPGSRASFDDESALRKSAGQDSRIPEILRGHGLSSLYLYQANLLQDLLDGNSIGLFAPTGSGKKTAVAVAAGVFTLQAGKTALIICENQLEARIIERMFEGPIGRFVRIVRHDQEHTALDISCDILITTDIEIKELFYEAFESVRHWASMLGLIVVSGLTSFSAPRISHLQGLLTFLKASTEGGSGLLHMVTGEPIGNPLNIINRLTGREGGSGISIFSDIGKGRNPYEIIAWLPPYIVDESESGQVVRREDYYKELGALFELFRDKNNILIWHSYAAIGKDKLLEWISGYRFKGKVTIINRLSEIHLSETGLFDGAILMGFPKDPRGLIEALGNILAPNSVAGVVLPNDPFSHFIVKTGIPTETLPHPEFIIPRQGSFITSAYLFLYAWLSKVAVIRKTDLEPYQLAGIEKNKEPLSRAGFLSHEDEYSYALNTEGIKAISKEWFFESQTADTVYIRVGSSDRYFDKHLFPEKLYQGAIRFHDEIPYQLIKGEGAYAFIPLSGIAPVKRVPLLDHKISEDQAIETLTGDFQITLSKADIDTTWGGFKEYKSFTVKPCHADVIESQNTESFKKSLYIFRITADSCGHEFAQLLRIWLPVFFSNIFDHYELFNDSNNLFLYGIRPDEHEARNLLLTLPSILRKALIFSKDLLLYSCPCKAGCPYCLEIFECSTREGKIDKKSILTHLLERLKEKRDSAIKLKYAGLGHSEAQKSYEEITRKVFSVFEKKLDLRIERKVPIVAVKASALPGKGCVGSFNGDLVKVVEKLDEAKATEVIAHEYAHNWAAENAAAQKEYPAELPADEKIKDIMKKLISEGFAQWVAFKILDHFGLESSMSDIYLWDFDEYGEGFRVLKWLEDNHGFMAVLNYLKNGIFSDEDGTERGLNALLEKSGFKERVLHWVMNKNESSP